MKRAPKPSRYFAELLQEYQAELDDLATDSEGADVLQKRLKDKRREFAALAPLCAEMPLLAASCFFGAFRFPEHRAQAFEALLGGVPGEFPSWGELASQLETASWAAPLVATALEQDGGEDFMALVAGLEFARLRDRASSQSVPFDASPAAGEGEGGEERGRDEDGLGDEGLDDDERDDETRGEDYLEDQGFDRRTGE